MSFLLEARSLEELETIEEYDYFNRPLLFSCRNSAGQIFFAIWVKETKDFELYLCVPMSQQRFEYVDKGTIDIRDAFLKSESGFVYEVKILRENSPDVISTIPCEKINEKWLPPVGESLKSDPQTLPVLAE